KRNLWSDHGLLVYSIVFVKPGSIPRTSSGKIRRYTCQQQFVEGTLTVVNDWCQNPQHRQQFRSLQRDLAALLTQIKQSRSQATS
ncbi:MAG: fatty acyl-AMP ligase, partial [Merismopedia sp. SIO2A8]|nr:fatty acyl-AMP ligase [Merismopedia sp. SIO2A8]